MPDRIAIVTILTSLAAIGLWNVPVKGVASWERCSACDWIHGWWHRWRYWPVGQDRKSAHVETEIRTHGTGKQLESQRMIWDHRNTTNTSVRRWWNCWEHLLLRLPLSEASFSLCHRWPTSTQSWCCSLLHNQYFAHSLDTMMYSHYLTILQKRASRQVLIQWLNLKQHYSSLSI